MDLAQTAEPCEKALSMSMLASGKLFYPQTHLELKRSMIVAYGKVCCSRSRLILETSVVTDDAERTNA